MYTKNKLGFMTILLLGCLMMMGSLVLGQYNDRYEEDEIDGPGVILYRHADFRGPSIFVRAGRNLRDLERLGWNDKISSIELVDGATVRIYQHARYRGQSVLIKRDIHDLAEYSRNIGSTWNDRISSVKVYQRRRGSRYNDDYYDERDRSKAIFWKHSNRRGSTLEGRLGGDRRISSRWNDEISSVWVKRGYKLTLYEHAQYRGRRLVLKGKGSNGSFFNLKGYGFNDKTSSYRLTRTGTSRYKKYKKPYKRRY